MSHEKSIEADEKTVLAVATAMVDSALAHSKTNVFVQARAAIGAYRDAEIERLTAKIEAWETAIDSWMVTNWVGVYDSKKGVSETLSLCLERALDVQRDALRAKLEAAERDAERLTAELAQLKSVPNTIYKAVEQVLDENSAWIARPSAEVTRRIAMAAGIVWAVQLEEKLGDAFQREQLVQGLRDYIRQLEMGMDDLRAKLEAAERMMQEAAAALLPDTMDVTKAYNILCRPIKAARGGEA